MANYATNLFFCSTENESDLEKVEKFLEDYIDGEFYSKWDFPEALINEMIESLEDKQGIYIRVLTNSAMNM